ncbi:hypothetical protein, partial [Micromonospora sp. NBS 11-29]|uniref:hypothetical protein n=1 Tax=Micromonospora sp. NBS 11-29 TaxID=1960879 RepID=UPI001C38D3D0
MRSDRDNAWLNVSPFCGSTDAPGRVSRVPPKPGPELVEVDGRTVGLPPSPSALLGDGAPGVAEARGRSGRAGATGPGVSPACRLGASGRREATATPLPVTASTTAAATATRQRRRGPSGDGVGASG